MKKNLIVSKISVILPCYHVEEYLPDIMADLREQSFQDFEIILVNDGGGDKLLSLMYELKAQDGRISIVDKPNGGLSSARNAGLNIAKGEYVVFIDADDRVKPFHLECLLNAILAEDMDIAVQGFTYYYTLEGRTEIMGLDASASSLPICERIEYLLSLSHERNSACNKMYRTEFLQSHNLRFNETLFYAEDTVFNMQCLLFTDCITFLPENSYIYVSGFR